VLRLPKDKAAFRMSGIEENFSPRHNKRGYKKESFWQVKVCRIGSELLVMIQLFCSAKYCPNLKPLDAILIRPNTTSIPMTKAKIAVSAFLGMADSASLCG